MKTKILSFLTAMLLGCINAFAQSGNNEPLKGDVNEDGVVDVADIVAIIDIMKANTPQPSDTYYWYVGQTDPATMSSTNPVVTDNSSPGWRKIGTTLPSYSSSNMLWNGDNNNITFDSRNTYYIAVPRNNIKIYDADGDSVMDSFTGPATKTINNINYYVYTSTGKARAFGYQIY